MFTTAIINKMMEVDESRRLLGFKANDGEEEEGTTNEQEESYAEFTRSVYRTLLEEVDRRGYEHTTTLSAQDDVGPTFWRELTGIPLTDFGKRWNSLQDWGADQMLRPGDPQNPEPRVTQVKTRVPGVKDFEKESKVPRATASGRSEEVGHVLGKRRRQTSRLYGGQREGLKAMILNQAKEYLDAFKGQDDTGEDGGLHGLLHNITEGKGNKDSGFQRGLCALQHRMTLMSIANDYLQLRDIPPPNGLSCYDCDRRIVHAKIPAPKLKDIFELIDDRPILFPMPVKEQGRFFRKPQDYLAAAFHAPNVRPLLLFLPYASMVHERSGEDR